MAALTGAARLASARGSCCCLSVCLPVCACLSVCVPACLSAGCFRGSCADCCLCPPAVPYPPQHRLSLQQLFEGGKPNAELLRTHLVKEGRVEEDAALKVINDGANILRQEKCMLEVEAPITGGGGHPGTGFKLGLNWRRAAELLI